MSLDAVTIYVASKGGKRVAIWVLPIHKLLDRPDLGHFARRAAALEEVFG